MKQSTTLKTCLVALCLLTVHGMSAGAETAAEASKGVLSSVIAKMAKTELKSFVTTPQGIAVTATMISLFIFFSREPDTKPNRYNLEDVKANPTFQNILKFVYYYLLDGVIGHKRQSSSSKIGEDGKTLVVKPGVPARGLFGQISELAKPTAETLGFVAVADVFLNNGVDGFMEWLGAKKLLGWIL